MEVKADQVIAIKGVDNFNYFKPIIYHNTFISIIYLVMRLSRPLLTSSEVVVSDPWDLLGQFDSMSLDEDFKQISTAGTNLILPQSFGYLQLKLFKHSVAKFYMLFILILRTIYLGETFQSYLRVQNIGPQPVSNVSVKVIVKRNISLKYRLN